MPISNKTREKAGLPPDVHTEIAQAFGVTTHKNLFSKAEENLLKRKVVSSKALTIEDDPWDLLPKEKRVDLLRPAYEPATLIHLVHTNNTLGQLVDAMEVNIDGTGYDINPKDQELEEDEEDPQIKGVKEFFDQPNLTESFTSVRRKLRRDRESLGYAYLEVVRNTDGEIAMLNYLDAKLVRMVKYDQPVEVEKTITRNGKEEKLKVLLRERRYAMMIGTRVRYFRDFGTSREIDANTGKWIEKGNQPALTRSSDRTVDEGDTSFRKAVEAAAEYNTAPKPEDLPSFDGTKVEIGNEIICFKDKQDITTPYGVPRWINQIPSVMGSRKAEELNLEYFYHGGLPPLIIFVQGGQLSKGSKDVLNSYLGGEAKGKVRAVVADVFSTSGNIDANSQVKVQVERFGGDRLSDSLFENYDQKCSDRVRSSFRLPPLFVGHAQDYSFATAYASYLVAEAQVFKPERDLFDEVINNTLMRELAPGYVYRSLPMTVHDVAIQLQGLELIKDSIEPESLVNEVKELLGITVQYQEPTENPMYMAEVEAMQAKAQAPFLQAGAKAGKPPKKFPGKKTAGKAPPQKVGSPNSKPGRATVAKSELRFSDDVLLMLAEDWAAWMLGERTFNSHTVRVMKSFVNQMDPAARRLFTGYVGLKLAPKASYDPDGVAELMACAGDALG